MQKTGRTRIKLGRLTGLPTTCASCGRAGVFRVRFEDMYGKLDITLCDECEKKDYNELCLQARFVGIGQIKPE